MSLTSLRFNKINVTNDHKDTVHDIAFDYHGNRIATCSSDNKVRVYDLNDSGKWTCTHEVSAHYGAVWRISWAHPDYGQVFATCSFDRKIIIWGEKQLEDSPNKTSWQKMTTLCEFRSNITDVKFGAPHLGLFLAACSQDGAVRVYECADIFKLETFSEVFPIPIHNAFEASKQKCSCLAWNHSKYDFPLIAVGSDDTSATSTKLILFELVIGKYGEEQPLQRYSCPLEQMVSITEPVYDVAFAPAAGKSYHLLAVATKGVQLIKLSAPVEIKDQSSGLCKTRYVSNIVMNLGGDMVNQVWRVSWNVLGTVLAAAGHDGVVRLWKNSYMNNWKMIDSLEPDRQLEKR